MSNEASANQDMNLYIRAAFLLDLDPDEQWCARASLGLESEQADWVAAATPSVVKRLLNEKLFLLARIEQLEAERLPDGAGLIAAERTRQVESEGWTAEHDRQHDDGDLGWAAYCYLFAAITGWTNVHTVFWPWRDSDWKPSDPVRMLVKAGALIAAEIDRLVPTEVADE